MRYEPIVAPTIKELFVQRIEDMILSGELKPGDKLPSERELADTMKISKTIVHEGIRELARCGFLDVASRRGVTVADYANTGNLDTLLAIMNRNVQNMDKRTICSLLDLRCYLECPAMELLAANHTAEDIATLRTLCERAALAVEGKTEESFAEALYYYHRTLMKLSGNTITPLILNALITAVLPFWSEYEQTNGVEAALQGLVHFTDLVEQGEGEQAAQLLRDGIRRHKEEHGYL